MNEEFSELDKEIFENTDKTDKIVLKNVPANIAKAGIINRIINKNDRNGKVINIVESKKDSKYLVFIQMADYL
jgi:adenylate kinase family enzyme